MAIKFYNIRSKQTLVAETEPQIAALWASSDHSPNITQGQDFGWRLAPEVVVEMDHIKEDLAVLQQISLIYRVPLESVGEKEILAYISRKTEPGHAPVATDADYSNEYDEEVRRLKQAAKGSIEPATEVEVEANSSDLPQRKSKLN